MWAGGANGLPAPRLQSRPSVAPAGVPAMVWHLYRAIFTDLNTNGYCLIVSRFISQTSSALAPAQLLQSKPLSLNRAAYCIPIKRIDLWPPPLRWGDWEHGLGAWADRRRRLWHAGVERTYRGLIKTQSTRRDVDKNRRIQPSKAVLLTLKPLEVFFLVVPYVLYLFRSIISMVSFESKHNQL